jgi:zinc transporter, ZIP family
VIGVLSGMPPVLQALLATTFTWGVTALGAALVFGTKQVERRLLDAMLAFAAGVMIAASFWSLLAPSIELSRGGPLPMWVPPLIGFLAGGIFLRALDLVLPHLHPGHKMADAEGIPTSWRRSVLLVSAITLHNIPEGLAVGVAFGAAAAGISDASIGGAGSRHRAPELPRGNGRGHAAAPGGDVQVKELLLRSALCRGRARRRGNRAAAVVLAKPILPYALAFAAGAMIFVVAEELIPEAKRGSPDIAALALMVGFAVMMTLDVALA